MNTEKSVRNARYNDKQARIKCMFDEDVGKKNEMAGSEGFEPSMEL